jgi:hypothetical protein
MEGGAKEIRGWPREDKRPGIRYGVSRSGLRRHTERCVHFACLVKCVRHVEGRTEVDVDLVCLPVLHARVRFNVRV